MLSQLVGTQVLVNGYDYMLLGIGEKGIAVGPSPGYRWDRGPKFLPWHVVQEISASKDFVLDAAAPTTVEPT